MIRQNQMSKSHIPVKHTSPAGSSKPAKKSSNSIKHLAKVAEHKAKAIKAGNIIPALIILAAAACIFGAHIAGAGASTALLYIFAYDGKFSGRTDGNVMMRNGRARAFAVPSLVQNGYTTPVRSLLAQLSQGFRGLTQSQIAAWNAFEMTITNRFGQSKIIKGKDCYVRLNANLINVGSAPISDPPVLADVPGITSFTLTATAPNTLNAAFAPSPTDANVAHLVFATANISAGISRPSKSAFRLITVLAPSSATPGGFGAAFVTKFGNLIVGQKVFIKLVPIEINTGQAGVGIINFDVVA